MSQVSGKVRRVVRHKRLRRKISGTADRPRLAVYRSIKNISVQAIDLNGTLKIIPASDIRFSYRGSNLDDNLIFVSATFQGKIDNKLNIEKKIISLTEKKKNSQPTQIKTCGSTFKNPEKNKAWELIKKSGCAGMKMTALGNLRFIRSTTHSKVTIFAASTWMVTATWTF